MQKLTREDLLAYPKGIRKPIDPDAVAANRAGRLTADQKARLEQADRRTALITGIAGATAFVVTVVAFASLLLGVAGPSLGTVIGVGVAALVALLAFIPFTWRLVRKSRDVRAGLVTSTEGPISKRRTGDRDDHQYSVTVGAKRYRTSEAKFASLPDAGRVRLFVLPSSNEIVNFEQLDIDKDPGAR